MTDKKFTDEEIKKALECCNTRGVEKCKECPAESNCMDIDLYELALDLINRYEAEIERSNCHIQKLVNVTDDLAHECDCAKQEAIKEFAERLTYTLVINNEENTEYFDFAYTLETIDTLVKEMTEVQQ